MNGRFEGLVVQITGAASGFGRLSAQRFAAEGARLALSDVNEEGLAQTAQMLRDTGAEVITDRVDVSQEAEVKAHLDHVDAHYGQLDIGINNAGWGGEMAPLHLTSVEVFDRNMAINARGVFLGMKYQLPLMHRAGHGTILNLASAAGLVGAAQISAYAAAKHAVVGLTRAAADENAKKNIRVNALCPSFSDTPMVQEMAESVGARVGIGAEAAKAQIANRVPMGRVSRPEEVVPVMLFLCDPENSFMTGQAVAVDGGLTAI